MQVADETVWWINVDNMRLPDRYKTVDSQAFFVSSQERKLSEFALGFELE
jgi:hypothetical protein